ncbi:hypothetical protein BS47DRAFT_1347410 [Hydnum rufescens UP504]|uniref:Uncharacterized protein n=1 Tax=Hydnum rufescens UP504 TaxID=1448309 RepID=A0A9P6DUS0_9AGAM|nr:hypothetical protein BS47DRAFT_1347410 [Hydnum rufescens UP504]
MKLCSCSSSSGLNGVFPSFPLLTHQPLSSHFSECGPRNAPKDAKALMDSSGQRLTSEDICLVEKMRLEGTRSHLDLPEETCAQLKILKKDLSKTCSVLYQHHFWPTVRTS